MPEITRENPNAFKTLADALSALEGVEGKAGVLENQQYEDGTYVAQVAYWQEVGVPSQNIPPRSFMRSTALEQDAEWRDTVSVVSKRVIEGKMTVYDAMDTIARKAAGDIRAKISSITAPPLSPITIGARKYRKMGRKVTGATIGEIAQKIRDGSLDLSGVSTKPLVDSSLLLTSITHTVETSA